MGRINRCILALALLVGMTIEAQATCFDPVAYGAIPNDGLDDRVAFQAAIDAATSSGGGVVCIAGGHWRLTRAPIGSYNRVSALSTHGSHLAITGSGPSSVLEIVGDQGSATTNVISLDAGASDIAIRDLTIDTSGMTNTDEQTHAIASTGICSWLNGTCGMEIADIAIERVRFVHPNLPDFRKGDCVRLLGNTAATRIVRVKLIANTFLDCARADIVIQRNADDVAIIGNHFASPQVDQHIDGEASGGEGDRRLIVMGNIFTNGPDVVGDYDMALTSYAGVVITGNLFTRGLFLYRSTDVIVSDNVFETTFRSAYATIETGNIAERIQITNNVITRRGAPGSAIRAIPHSGGLPTELTISGNTITVDGNSNAIYMESPQGLTIASNSIRFLTAAPSGSAISLRAAQRDIRDVHITDNRIVSELGIFSAVRLEGSPWSIEGVTVKGNSSRVLSGQSLRCEASLGTFRGVIVYGLNRWAAPTCFAPMGAGN